MPECLYRAAAGEPALLLLSRLWSYASANTRWVHPSLETLSATMGLPLSTLRRRISELTAAGVMTRQDGTSRDGWEVSGWVLADEPPSTDGPRRPAARRTLSPGSARSPRERSPGEQRSRHEHDPCSPRESESCSRRENPSFIEAPIQKLPVEEALSGDQMEIEGAAPRPKSKAARAKDRALLAWEEYEAHRVRLWPRSRGRQPTDDDIRAIERLCKHIRKRLGCNEDGAWSELGAYGRGALEHAAAAERGETGDSASWATKLRKWRNDGKEWIPSRYSAWTAEKEAEADAPKTKRRSSRAPSEPEDQNYSERDW